MVRIVSLLLSFAVASSAALIAADRTLAAEGDYIAQTKAGDKPLSHWQLWHLRNGDYEVVDTGTKNASAVQIFRFDSQFLPIGYTKTNGPISRPRIPNAPAIPGWTIACQYKSKELICNAESSEGRKSTTSIEAKPPYVVVGEFYDLDFAWFMTGVVRLASSNGGKDGVVNVYAVTDGAKVGDIGLKPDIPMKVAFTGDETVQVMGKAQVVKKYELDTNDLSVLRVTSQGLVVSVSNRGSDQVAFAMSGYKEYEPWGPGEPQPAPESPKASAPAPESPVPSAAVLETPRHVQVPAGVMVGLLIRRVQPVYPPSAKENHIQGTVVLQAVIGTDGRIAELTPISGPAELTQAALDAVKQWQYRPYVLSGEPAEAVTQIKVNFKLSP